MNKNNNYSLFLTEVNDFFTKKEFIKAERKISEFIEQNPKNHIGFYLLGSNYLLMDRLKLAEIYFNKCNEITKYAPAYKSLGVIYFKLAKRYKYPGLAKQAVIFLKAAINTNPKFYLAYFELANFFKYEHKFDEAIAQYKKAIETNPKYAEAYLNLGNIFKERKNFDEALKMYQKSSEVNPKFLEANYNISQIYLKLRKLDLGLQYLKKTLEKKPNSAKLHIKIGTNHLMQKKYELAEEFYKKGINLRESNIKNSNQNNNELNTGESIDFYSDQGLAEIYNNLAAALRFLEKDPEGLTYIKKALEIDSNNFNANLSLATMLLIDGDYKTAYKIYEKFKDSPKMTLGNFFNSQLQMIPIPHSNEEIEQYRKILLTNIKDLKLKKFPVITNEGNDNNPLFFISYHNQDNIHFAKELSKNLLTTCQDLSFDNNFSQHKKEKNSKIRIMFLSENFFNHTIGKLYWGYIKQINRKKFEVIVASVQFKKDFLSNAIKGYADKFIHLSPMLNTQRKEILSEKPDIIFYTDIGFSSFSYFLSFSRLAPVQFTSWGHPDTTGVKSIDYFLSSTKMEPSDSKKYYTENLIMIDRLPMYYYPPVINKIFSRKELGITHKGTLYGCLQSLFKLHPDFDEIVAKIISKDKNSKIVMIEQRNGRWNKILQNRWSKKYPILLEKVQFIKRLNKISEFTSVIKCCDVLLDPFHFGSGNSFHESMLYGTPTVSLIGKFMRSRVVYGAYQQMKIDNAPVTKNYDEYISLAVDLASDKKKNLALREKLKLASQKYLYRDKESVVQFEAFLEESLKSFSKNKKLEDGLVIS